MPFRMPSEPRRRRLSRTTVDQAIRDTKTRAIVFFVCDTKTLDDGRKQVLLHLVDRFYDARADSPAAAELIDALERDGWTVVHEQDQAASRLVVTEPGEG